MKKLGFFAAIAAMFIGFSSCEKVEPTALETSDLTATKVAGYVYYTKITSDGMEGDVLLYSGKAYVNIEVTELDAEGKATSNVILVKTSLKAGKYEAKIPVAVGKKAKCKVSCYFTQDNNDAKLDPSEGNIIVSSPITYKGESEKTISYGETLFVELQGTKVGSLNDPYHF